MDVSAIRGGGSARPSTKPKALEDDGFGDALAGALGVTAAPERSPPPSRPDEGGRPEAANRKPARPRVDPPAAKAPAPKAAEGARLALPAAAVSLEEAPAEALALMATPAAVVQLSAGAAEAPALAPAPEDLSEFEQFVAPLEPDAVEPAAVEAVVDEPAVVLTVEAPAAKPAEPTAEGLRWEGRVAAAAPKIEVAAPPAAAPPRPAPPPAAPSWTPAIEASVMRQITDTLRPSADGAVRSAEIALDPAELGRVRVRVEMEGGNARVMLAAEHAHVRELMAAGVERLRQDLLAQGVQNVDVEVRQEAGGFADRGDDGREPAERGEQSADRVPRTVPAYARRAHTGRIDVTA